jgi:hypothetical protein
MEDSPHSRRLARRCQGTAQWNRRESQENLHILKNFYAITLDAAFTVF